MIGLENLVHNLVIECGFDVLVLEYGLDIPIPHAVKQTQEPSNVGWTAIVKKILNGIVVLLVESSKDAVDTMILGRLLDSDDGSIVEVGHDEAAASSSSELCQ
jgi:hypothetical protein